MKNVACVVSLGSNLGKSAETLRRAVEELKKIPQISELKVSAIYKTAPLELLKQPDFFNQVVTFKTFLAALPLLKKLLQIEGNLGRQRNKRFAARTVDCDLILYGQEKIATDQLTVPHPRYLKRLFVLQPLLELEPDLLDPLSQQPLSGFAQQLYASQRVEKYNA